MPRFESKFEKFPAYLRNLLVHLKLRGPDYRLITKTDVFLGPISSRVKPQNADDAEDNLFLSIILVYSEMSSIDFKLGDEIHK